MTETTSNDPYIESENDDLIELDSLEDVSISLQAEQTKAKRRKTSNIWGFFEMFPNSDKGDGKPRAKCKLCGATYLAMSKYGNENLKVHIETCLERNSRNIGQLMLCQNSGSVLVSASKFAEKFRELWVDAIVKHDLPFQLVECSDIRAAFQCLRPDVPLISINDVKANLVKMYHRERKRVKCMLNDVPGRISLTSDMWTSIATDGYMRITAHFLDKNWVLQKRVLNFSLMPPPHNGISLSEKVYNLLCKWGIEDKIFILTFDNASSNDISVEILRTQLNSKKALIRDGEFFHLRCCARILNLVVQDGLKEINCAIQKVHDNIKYVKGSQTSKHKFLDSINQMSLDSKKGLRQDVPTRWDSTFLMLESAIFYRRAFCHLELTDSNFKHCLSTSEWDKVEKISTFLAVFYDATRDFSGMKYPTANLYFPAVFLIYLRLKEQCKNEDDYMRKMSYQMLAPFEKYWSEFNVMLAIAIILDPRYKLWFVEFSYKKLYGNSSQEYLHVRAKLESFFMEYSSGTRTSSASERNVSRVVREAQFKSFSRMTRQIMKEFDSYQTDELAAKKSQLELYLDEPNANRNANLDILDFWKGNEFRYPDLANMARDVLSVPVSIVTSESIFIVDGRIIDQFKSALKPDILEALVCTRDWLYGEQETQEMKLDELVEDVMELDFDKSKEDTLLPLQVL